MNKKEIKEIWHKYHKVFLLSFLFFIFCYSFKLFTYSYSLDTEAFMMYKDSFLNSWLQINRFSLVALKKIFFFIPFNIYLINWLTVILFYFASWLIYFTFAKIHPKLLSTKKALTFVTIIGSSPIFLEQFNFTLQSFEIAFFLILFQIGIIWFEKYFENKKKYYLIFTVIIECICLGAYQSFAPLFATEILIILFLKIANNNLKKVSEILKYLAISFLAFILAFILYIYS